MIDTALAVSVKSARSCSPRPLVPAMAEHGGGVIINMGSINGDQRDGRRRRCTGPRSPRSIGLTRALAAEYGPAGIRVTTRSPRDPRLTVSLRGPAGTSWTR